MKPKFSVLVIFLAALSVFPNDGSYEIQGNGGAVFPEKNNAITMEKEEISINVRPIDFYKYTIDYNCTFYFRNMKKTPQTVLIGFPHKLNSYMGPDYEHENPEFVATPTGSAVQDFKFIVNTRETLFTVYQAQENPDLTTVPSYDIVYTVKLTFAPGESIVIKNTYWMPCFHNPYPNPMGGGYSPTVQNRVYYILKSGRTWENPIGRADITITFHTPEDFFNVNGTPGGYKITGNPQTVSYQFEDFRPSQDINLTFHLKKEKPETAIEQIQKAYKAADYVSAYYLLLKYDATTLNDSKDKKTKDTIRMLAYKTAEKLYRKDHWKVIDLYKAALHHTYSYTPDLFFTFNYLHDKITKSYDFENWEHEGEKNAPCYYITYNLACVYSMMGEVRTAGSWLDIALRMNPKLSKLAEIDKDLDNLKMEDTPLHARMKDGFGKNLSDFKDVLIPEYINAQGKRGETPLMRSIGAYGGSDWSIYKQLINALLDNNADPNIRDHSGKTALHHAAESLRNGQEWTIVKLIEKGANVNARDNDGNTPFLNSFYSHSSTSHNRILEVLLDYSDDIDVTNNAGFTPLLLSVRSPCKSDIAKMLIDHGADIKRKNKENQTIAMLLTRNFGCMESLLPYIIKHNGVTEDIDINGRNILHLVMENFDLSDYYKEYHKELLDSLKEIVKLLLNAGIDPGVRDFFGYNAYDIAGKQDLAYIIERAVKENAVINNEGG